MADFVRARLDGTDYTMARFWAKRLDAQIIQSPTHNDDGTLRGPTSAATDRKAKPKTTVDKSSAAKQADDTTATTEENNS